MWKLLLISLTIALLPSPHTAEPSVSCKKLDNDFEVCKDSSGALRSVRQLTALAGVLRLHKEGISSIVPGAFQNFTAFELEIVPRYWWDSLADPCVPTIINITPESFHGLSSVGMLTLQCVTVKGVPSPFKSLNFLFHLRFDRNQFTDIPQELCRDVANLKFLTVTRQQIKTLSNASFSDVSGALEYLRLESIGLEVIEPQSFAKFHHLRILDLSGNNLEVLRPDMFDGLDELTDLTVTDNRLKEIELGTFCSLKNLQFINLERNRLKRLPDGIFYDLKTLKSLKIYGNLITVVPCYWFYRLSNLQELSVSFDEKIDIEPGIFRGLNLSNFTLDADSLNGWGAEAFSSLTTYQLILIRDKPINFKPNLFKGLTVTDRVIIYEDKKTTNNIRSWGLEKKVKIYSKAGMYSLGASLYHI